MLLPEKSLLGGQIRDALLVTRFYRKRECQIITLEKKRVWVIRLLRLYLLKYIRKLLKHSIRNAYFSLEDYELCYTRKVLCQTKFGSIFILLLNTFLNFLVSASI